MQRKQYRYRQREVIKSTRIMDKVQQEEAQINGEYAGKEVGSKFRTQAHDTEDFCAPNETSNEEREQLVIKETL